MRAWGEPNWPLCLEVSELELEGGRAAKVNKLNGGSYFGGGSWLEIIFEIVVVLCH